MSKPTRKSNTERRRALKLLASNADGCTEAIMLAHGFTVEFLVDRVRAGLATAQPERMRAGGHPSRSRGGGSRTPAGGCSRSEPSSPRAPMTQLVLKRASASRPSGEWGEDDYDVLADGAVVGRIMRAAAAPEGTPWLWTLAFGHHEDRTPTSDYEATREAAMAPFAKSWRWE
jgi:hypothetical protein